ncbi:hypothetical protein MKQ70_28115 [Chitinophaga sedimenti]|nr:hypothetical protein [Chitinophaga sedimenti]MCK7558651.1 hypothetical protein [Chitinophaga sedimenti]
MISKYVEDNNITRPDDFVMKSVVNKSGLKVFIIQNIDKKYRWKRLPKIKNSHTHSCSTKWKPL